jgi:hypothetical protein
LDLVIKDQDRLMVVGVTVRYENRISLADAHREKARKYKETTEYIKQKLCDGKGFPHCNRLPRCDAKEHRGECQQAGN